MQTTTGERNKLIAEFMGYRLVDAHPPFAGQKKWRCESFVQSPMYKLLDGNNYEQLYFDSSWEWLMPSCLKWDTLKDSVVKYNQGEYEIRCDMLDITVTRYEILPAFEQLVENIEWYNTAKQQYAASMTKLLM